MRNVLQILHVQLAAKRLSERTKLTRTAGVKDKVTVRYSKN